MDDDGHMQIVKYAEKIRRNVGRLKIQFQLSHMVLSDFFVYKRSKKSFNSVVGAPVLIDSEAGYQIIDENYDSTIWVRWPEKFSTPINRFSMSEGAWAATIERSSDDDAAYLLYWLYPFSHRLHVWRLSSSGERIGFYDLDGTEKRRFFYDNRYNSFCFIIRLYMYSLELGDIFTCISIRSKLYNISSFGSNEAIYCILLAPWLFSDEKIRACVARAIVALSAVSRSAVPARERNIQQMTAGRLAQVISYCDSKFYPNLKFNILQAIDFYEAFGDERYIYNKSRIYASNIYVCDNFHENIYVDSNFHGQSIAIVGHAANSVIDFHVLKSEGDTRSRVMSGVGYASYILSIYESERLFDSVPYDCGDKWIINLEVGDLPGRSKCVAFEREVKDKSISLIPDLYYFLSRGFKNDWINGAVPPWNSKKPMFAWRGSTTGGHGHTADTIVNLPRFRLCEIGREIGPIADLGIFKIVQERSEEDKLQIEYYLKKINIWQNHMPLHVMGGYKFLLEIDGNSNSWGFFAKLIMGCCVLKVDSPFEQWFYKDLKPWVHYVPIAQDMSNLLETMEWCLLNEPSCRDIAFAGRAFAEERTFDREMKAAAVTLASQARPI